MENIIVEGIITATSKKQSDQFKQDNPTKTAYVTAEKESRKKLLDFGLTEYTSKDGEGFFIIKFSANTAVYLDRESDESKPFKLHTMDTPNFKTLAPVTMNIIKSENMGNDFFRIQAFLVLNPEVFEKIEQQNPFAEGDSTPKKEADNNVNKQESTAINDDDLPF